MILQINTQNLKSTSEIIQSEKKHKTDKRGKANWKRCICSLNLKAPSLLDDLAEEESSR